MKKLIFIATRVIRMPLLLITLSLLGALSPFLFEREISRIIYILILMISICIPLFKNKLLLVRSLKTSSLGVIMISIYYYFGYESWVWLLTLQIIGFGSALFFILDVDEQIKNYKRLIQKDMETLSHKSFYKKLATSRCSVDMYFAVLDTVKKKKTTIKLMRRNFTRTIRIKDSINTIYKPWFFFPVTKNTLWQKKLNDLRGQNPIKKM